MKTKDNRFDCFSWDNISIEKYFEIKRILDDKDDDDLTKNVKLVALITGKEEDEVWDMDLTEVGGYIDKLRFLNKFDLPKHTNLKVQLPNYKLVVMNDLSKINVSQYVDFNNFITKPLEESMDKILSIFLIPEGCKYNTDYDILDVQREIKENLSFRTAEGFFNFFIKRYSRLLMRFLISSERVIKRLKDQEKKEELMKKREMVMESWTHLMHLIGCC